MKTLLLCAWILGILTTAQARDPFFRPGTRCRPDAVAVTPVPRPRERALPPPVAEEAANGGERPGGALQRLVAAPDPLQMFNPAAPRAYGNAADLLTYGSDRIVDGDPNEPREHPTGIKLLSFFAW